MFQSAIEEVAGSSRKVQERVPHLFAIRHCLLFIMHGIPGINARLPKSPKYLGLSSTSLIVHMGSLA